MMCDDRSSISIAEIQALVEFSYVIYFCKPVLLMFTTEGPYDWTYLVRIRLFTSNEIILNRS